MQSHVSQHRLQLSIVGGPGGKLAKVAVASAKVC